MYQQHDWQPINDLYEEFLQNSSLRLGDLKRRAAEYMGIADLNKPLSRTDIRKLLSKAYKIRRSKEKGERARSIQLEKQMQTAFNYER